LDDLFALNFADTERSKSHRAAFVQNRLGLVKTRHILLLQEETYVDLIRETTVSTGQIVREDFDFERTNGAILRGRITVPGFEGRSFIYVIEIDAPDWTPEQDYREWMSYLITDLSTDEQGFYTITDLPPGSYKIIARNTSNIFSVLYETKLVDITELGESILNFDDLR